MNKLFQIQVLFCIFTISHVFPQPNSTFKLGVENITQAFIKNICPDTKEKCAIGLITNQTGVDQNGKSTADVIVEKGMTVQYIFAPEHGLNGTLAERDVHDSIDEKRAIPIISLYGNGTGKMIAPEYLNAIDCLFFDIQDSGMRHYTYISTLLSTMKVAAEHNKPFVVLDRPNPLGSMMEGPLVESDLISFISIASIPLRHGMTIGELAGYFNKHVLQKPAELQVVTMQDYDRKEGFAGKFIHQLSPNLQSLQSCYGYSFLGLLGEIEPFDVGVGTPMAFQCITLPKKMHVSSAVWQRLQTLLSSFGVKSHFYRHTNPKHNRRSKGLRLEFSDMSHLHAFELFIAVLQFFKKEGIAFSFSAAFNKAVGTKEVQEVIAGALSKEIFFNKIKTDLEQFRERAKQFLLY